MSKHSIQPYIGLRRSRSFFSQLHSDQQGFGLVEVLLSAGLAVTLAMGTTSLMNQQNQQQVRLSARSAVLETKLAIATALSDTANCTSQFSGVAGMDLSSMNTSSPQDLPSPISLTQLTAADATGTSAKIVESGKPLSAFPAGPKVTSITLKDILRKSGTDDTLYTGMLYVNFDSIANLKPDLKPIKVKVDFTTNSGALTSRTINLCNTFSKSSTTSAVTAATQGGPCSTPGAIGYDSTNSVSVYCNSSGLWSAYAPKLNDCTNGQFMVGINPDGSTLCTSQGGPGAPCQTTTWGGEAVTGFTLVRPDGTNCCVVNTVNGGNSSLCL